MNLISRWAVNVIYLLLATGQFHDLFPCLKNCLWIFRELRGNFAARRRLMGLLFLNYLHVNIMHTVFDYRYESEVKINEANLLLRSILMSPYRHFCIRFCAFARCSAFFLPLNVNESRKDVKKTLIIDRLSVKRRNMSTLYFSRQCLILFLKVSALDRKRLSVSGARVLWDANLIVITYDEKGKKKNVRFPFNDERNICSALFLDGTKHVRQ